MYKWKYRIFVGMLLMFLLLIGSGCVAEEQIVCVTWVDADGRVIATEQVVESYDPASRELPEDSDEWHYTGWQQTHSGDIIVCSALRVSNRHFIWKDYDGTTLKEIFVPENEEMPNVELPESSEKWEYTEWDQTSAGNEFVYEAKREPNKNYFIGNVFQIVLKDEKGDVLGSGSGFVINQDGWFVTNNHVMPMSNMVGP